MATAKDIVIKPIKAAAANAIVKKIHYSGKVVPNSQLHFGVFLDGKLEGAMQFGPPMDKRKSVTLVSGTKWSEMIELNRMAFSDDLPRFSESRAIGYVIRLIKKKYPQIKWIQSFSDGCQCGDGTIYRASGFVLTAIKENSTIIRLADGSVAANMTFSKGRHILSGGGAKTPNGAEKLKGNMLRYIYFIDKSYKEKLTVPILPFSKIDEMGAGMYKGKARDKQAISSDQLESGGAAPTITLQSSEAENAIPIEPDTKNTDSEVA